MIIDTSKVKQAYWSVKYHDENKVKMSQSGAEAIKHYIKCKTLLQAESLQNFSNLDGNLRHTSYYCRKLPIRKPSNHKTAMLISTTRERIIADSIKL